MKWNRLALAALVIAAASPLMLLAEETPATGPAMTTKAVMKKFFNGDKAPLKTILAGKADEAAIKEFLAAAQTLNAGKPHKGDEAAWKTRTQAIVDATQGLLDKKEGALDTLKTETNCATCHKAFK